MTVKEVIEILQESNLWESLAEQERQEAIKYALKDTQLYSPEKTCQ